VTLIETALILFAFLAVLLTGGLWIALALLATGFVGMQFAGGNIPAGSVLATVVWGNSASWSLAAQPQVIREVELLLTKRH
jgi:hypothetical protein